MIFRHQVTRTPSRRGAVLLLVVSLAAGLTTFPSQVAHGVGLQQENAFLKLGSIKGKAITPGFQDAIVITNLTYGVQQAGQYEFGNRLSGPQTTFPDMKIDKDMDSSSPALAQACATKEQFPKAEISLVSGKDIYARITLEGVIVSSVSVAFQSGTARPLETVTLRYMKATWEWGTAKAAFDLMQNVKK